MPELPEVETTVRGLARHLDGERIERVALNRPDMRFRSPKGWSRRSPARASPGSAGARSTASCTPTGRRRWCSTSA
jgi:formamidopyrimidine-DNA glycosylase